MASNIQKTIDILFNGVDNVSGVLSDIEGSINETTSNIQDIAEPFQNVTNAVLLLDAALLGVVATGTMLSASIESEATKMKNALGLTTEEAERFEEVARRVYTQGYGEDLAESFDAVTLAQQRFGDSAETDIEKVVVAASRLKDTFGVDYRESLSAVDALMKNFGISSEEAFDFIAAGFQRGLNGSDDFIDTINEYSTQFSNGGASAGEFFSVLETGFQTGILGTDKAADAFKEFRVRIQDGSKTTADALKQIGLGPQFVESLSTGEITAIQAFNTVIDRIAATEDKSIQLQAGVGLIGTQFEDLGTKAALSISTTATQIDNLKGTLENFDTDTFEKNLTSAWRTAIDAVSNLGIWDTIKDRIGEVADEVSISFSQVIQEIDTSQIEEKAAELFDIFAQFFEDANLDLTSVEGVENALRIITESIESVIEVSTGMAEIFTPIASAIVSMIDSFNSLDSGTKELTGNILALGTALGTIAGLVGAGGALLSGISSLSGALGVSGALSAGISGLIALFTGPAGLAVALGAGAIAIANFVSEQNKADSERTIAYYENLRSQITELTDKINALPAEVKTVDIYLAIEAGDFERANELLEAATEEAKTIEIQAKVDKEDEAKVIDFFNRLSEIPNLTQAEIEILGNIEDVDEFEAALADIEGLRKAEISVEVDQNSINQATETLTYFVDGEERTIEVPVETTGIQEAKKKIEDQIPSEKMMEIRLQGDIDTELAQIKASAETAQAAFEYRATVDVAQIEAETERIKSAFDSISAAIQTSADVYSAAFSGAESSSYQARNEALDILQQEQEYREQSFELQKKLTEAQLKYLEAKSDAFSKGDLGITIDSTGLEPALEMIMFEIIEKVQIRANELASDMLLGL